jgi:hypothetical protein
MLETEPVGDPFTARVGHEDSNATIVIAACNSYHALDA